MFLPAECGLHGAYVKLTLAYHLKKLDIRASVSDWKISTTQQGEFKVDLQVNSATQITNKQVKALEEKLEESLEKQVSLDVTVTPVSLLHAD